MSEASTTPHLMERTRHAIKAASRHDIDAYMDLLAPDPVFDLSDPGIGTFEGVTAIRGFLEDWWGTWGDHLVEVEEIVGLGQGVVFACVQESGRLVDSDGHVEQRGGWVVVWARRMIKSTAGYLDVDEGRAAAERLAEERG